MRRITIKLIRYIETLFNIGVQYHQPAGIKGRIAGQFMVHQHEPENIWTVSLLNARPTDHILEIGFGPGVAIQRLSRTVHQGRIAGVDISQTMVEAASRRNATAIRKGLVDLHCGEAEHLPFADATFDIVFSIHTLYFWANPLPMLTEIYRVLKPGGKACLTFLPSENWQGDKQAIPDIPGGTDTVQWMTRAGFSNPGIDRGPEHKIFREIAVIATK